MGRMVEKGFLLLGEMGFELDSIQQAVGFEEGSFVGMGMVMEGSMGRGRLLGLEWGI